MRNPQLRDNADKWWASQRQEADWARGETKLAEEAQRIDLGFMPENQETGEGEGRLKAKIQSVVKEFAKIAWGWEDKSTLVAPQPDSSMDARQAEIPPSQPTT